MGLIRKAASVTTLGAINFTSRREAQTKAATAQAKAAREEAKLLKAQRKDLKDESPNPSGRSRLNPTWKDIAQRALDRRDGQAE
jgi:hypothetical protein